MSIKEGGIINFFILFQGDLKFDDDYLNSIGGNEGIKQQLNKEVIAIF